MFRRHNKQGFRLDHDFGGRQWVGSREEQQDAYAFSIVTGDETSAEKILLVLADGMGGYTGGAQAAWAAVQGFIDGFYSALDAPSALAETPADACVGVVSDATADAPSEPDTLSAALTSANAAVDAAILADPDTLAEAGTTLVAAEITPGKISLVSVGDSPLFLWRADKLERLNADHSMRAVLGEKVKAGEMLASDLKTHPERYALTAALTGTEIPKIDSPAPTPLRPGDVIVAASDGILTLSTPAIEKILRKSKKSSAPEIAGALIDAVKAAKNPKQDNVTVAIIKV